MKALRSTNSEVDLVSILENCRNTKMLIEVLLEKHQKLLMLFNQNKLLNSPKETESKCENEKMEEVMKNPKMLKAELEAIGESEIDAKFVERVLGMDPWPMQSNI